MALTTEELSALKKRIEEAGRPLVFYDDDADGLASYLLVREANPDTIGIRAARGPELDTAFTRKVAENIPDLVLILDKPRVHEDFFSIVNTPTIWLDHHDPATQQTLWSNAQHVTYLNPRVHDSKDNRPTSYWLYQALGGSLWIATVGTTADWHDSLLAPFKKQYPSIAPKHLVVEDALYKSRLGTLVRVFNFLLKGNSKQIRRSISTLTKIHEPEEILTHTTPRGKYLWKQYTPVLAEYEEQYATAKKARAKKGVLVHVFPQLNNSLIAEVANQLLVERDAPIIIIGRHVGTEIKFSMRSKTLDLPPILEDTLKNVQGYGGGHREACGGSIQASDWETFLELIREKH